MRTLLLILLTSLSGLCFGQSIITIEPLSKWNSYSIADSVNSFINKHAPNIYYYVFNKNDELFTWHTTPSNGFRLDTPQMVDDGYLINARNENNSLALYWHSFDDTKQYKVSDNRAWQFIKGDDKLYDINNDDKQVFSGSIFELRKIAGKWTGSMYKKFSYAPWMVDADLNGNFIVSTSNNLIQIDKNKKTTVLAGEEEMPFDLSFDQKEAGKFFGDPHFIKVEDGYLVAINGGKFGSHLFWFSQNGSAHYEISEDEIEQFVKRGNKVYAITNEDAGLISTAYGRIIEIGKENGKWVSHTYLQLSEPPTKIATIADNFIVTTWYSLLKIDKNANTTVLEHDLFVKHSLRAKSLTVKSREIYVGMKYGVLKYDLSTNKESWLQPG